jgi:putative glutamine amidotransferase
MFSAQRPRIALLGRFAEQTSVTRFEGLVTARKLAEAIWNAGGEPLTLLPVANRVWEQRLRGIDGVLMPGGGDLDPATYGQVATSAEIYGTNALQDDADIELATYALGAGIPVLAICRGLQVVNVARGGTLVQDMEDDHRHHVAPVTITSFVDEMGFATSTFVASCFHHQMIDQLGTGLGINAHSAEGFVEAVKIFSPGWAFGVQWHPEDTAVTDRHQAQLFSRFVKEASRYRHDHAY